jgi:hypothetical protein
MSRAHSIVGVSEGRPETDFYRTPVEATKALLDMESFPGIIWEPACGDGAISKALIEAGLDVVSSDLFHYGYGVHGVDFLQSSETVDHIITNPPFKHAQDFVQVALNSTTGKVAMLLKLQFLEGRKRKVFFESSPLKKVYVFSNRLKLTRNGNDEQYKNGGMMVFAWFVWDHSHDGPPTIEWL